MMKYLIPFTLCLLLSRLGWAQDSLLVQSAELFQQGKYDQAIVTYRQAGELLLAKEDLPAYASCHLNIGQCYLETGNILPAVEQTTNTVEFLKSQLPNNQDLLFEALLLNGEALLKSGRNDQSLEVLKEAERIADSQEKLDAAKCYNDLGVAYWNNENKELALGYHEKALKIRSEVLGDTSVQVANSYINLGLVYLKEDFLDAVIAFTDALTIYKKQLGEQHPQVALSYSNLALANSGQKNYGAALRYLELTMDIWNQTFKGDHPNKAFTLSNKGRILEAQGKYDEALLAEQEALHMYLRLFGPKHPEVANTYALISSIQSKKGAFELALESIQQSIYANLFDQSYQDLYELPQLKNYFNADILLSSLYGKAQVLESLHFNKSLSPKDIKSTLKTYRLCDDLISEIRQIRLSEADKIRIGELSSDIYDNGIRIALYLADKTFHKNEYQEIAFNFCERSKSAVLQAAINDTKAKDFAGIPSEMISREDEYQTQISLLEQQLEDDVTNSAIRSQLFEVKQNYFDFIKQLESTYPNYYNLKYQRDLLSTAELQKNLPKSAAVISYFIGKQSIYIFVITPGKVDVYANSKPDNFLQKVNALRNSIKYRINEMYESTAASLYSDLIPDIPAQVNQLIIIPDGIVGTVPFEALKQADQDKFLVERYGISYDYSSSLINDRLSMESSSATGILLAAPISFEANDTRMATLPGSESEVKEIRYLFMSTENEPKIFFRDQASESMIKSSELGQYKYLHFATHGMVHESKPDLSRIFLFPDQQEDGNLYSGEIYALDINADLVTLSACETGLGKIAKGEGIIGLSRSLMYAGAKNLIVSLWQVSDASTSQLMIDFYQQHLVHSGNMQFSDDLRKAKLKLINSEMYSDPYYWAPFILIGK
ncbi:CHAT domain-containing protein [Marinoscillum sp.]|uniref:CHAT domain-containing protein n=1 Tax=Marinoscillum sp. TaxID=2024838 RepID=UPI003BACFD88